MEQKLESTKAAILCGGIGAALRLLAVGVGAAAPPFLRDALATPEPAASAVLFGLAAGFAQGALFGLTYRQARVIAIDGGYYECFVMVSHCCFCSLCRVVCVF